MSWHTSALLLHKDFSKNYEDLLEKLGFEGAELEGFTTFDDAASSSNEGLAVGTADGWTTLWGNVTMLFVDDDAVAKLAKKIDVFQMILEGTSGTAGFTWWTGGKMVRDWMRQAGEIIKDDGQPLAIEDRVLAKDDDDEQAVLQILMSLTLPLDKLDGIKFQQYALGDMI